MIDDIIQAVMLVVEWIIDLFRGKKND